MRWHVTRTSWYTDRYRINARNLEKVSYNNRFRIINFSNCRGRKGFGKNLSTVSESKDFLSNYYFSCFTYDTDRCPLIRDPINSNFSLFIYIYPLLYNWLQIKMVKFSNKDIYLDIRRLNREIRQIDTEKGNILSI